MRQLDRAGNDMWFLHHRDLAERAWVLSDELRGRR